MKKGKGSGSRVAGVLLREHAWERASRKKIGGQKGVKVRLRA